MLASRSRIYRHAINQRLGYDPRLHILRPARANETRSLQTVKLKKKTVFCADYFYDGWPSGQGAAFTSKIRFLRPVLVTKTISSDPSLLTTYFNRRTENI